MPKKPPVKLVTWLMPETVADLFAETLRLDSESISFDERIRAQLVAGLEVMEQAPVADPPKPAKFKFQPTRNVSGDYTNAERAERGEEACRVHPDSEGDEITPSDIIADILHFCDSFGLDGETTIKTARMHWQAER